MRKGLGTLLAVGVVLVGANYARTHYRSSSDPEPAAPSADTQPQYAEQKEAQQVVTVSGPLADLFTKKKPAAPAYHGAQNMVASDHVGNSPVGTGNSVLHKTFRLSGSVDVPFEVPAHAASPRLHGTFHSFVQGGEIQASDTDANLDFLLLNQQQHADFLSGRAGEAVFSAEDTHDQEVNFNISATFDQPAKYFLVFRNASRAQGKEIVQADFRIDF